MAFNWQAGKSDDPTVSANVSPPLRASQTPAMAFEPGSVAKDAGPAGEQPLAPTLRAKMGSNQPAVRQGMVVRRLTVTECERLMGFPDGYTDIPWLRGKYVPEQPDVGCPDGHRYRSLGNSMAVPVMAWVGARIKEQES